MGDAAPIPMEVSGSPSLDTARRLHLEVLRRLAEARARGVTWHLESSITVSGILSALYGFWIPKGRAAGVERKVILSKGHGSLALYAVLGAIGAENIPSIPESFAQPWSPLQAHPEASRLPGTVVSTGSLGQGLSVANGIVLAARLRKRRVEVAVVLGDGELDEGQVWEAAATAAAKRLHEIVVLIDRNRIQHTGPTEEVKPKEPLADKWRSFGWSVVTVPNTVEAIIAGIAARAGDRPHAVIVETGGQFEA